jgi:hypothetical protein
MPHAIAQLDASLSWICLSDLPPSGALDIIKVGEASRRCTVKLLLASSTDSGGRRGFLSPGNLRRNPLDTIAPLWRKAILGALAFRVEGPGARARLPIAGHVVWIGTATKVRVAVVPLSSGGRVELCG